MNEHEELLLMRFVFISHETTSTDLFDLFENNNETLYLATDDGVLRIINLLKVKTNTKVQNLSTDETIEQLALIPEGGVERLVCFSDDLLGLSTSEYLLLIDRKFPSKIFQKIPFQQTLYYWTLINQEDHQRILITVNSTQKFITISRQGTDPSAKFSPINIEFRSTVSDIKLIQTTTLIDNDDKKKTYVLILLDDLTVQLLDTNQLSQASLQPVGLFTRIRNYNVSLSFNFRKLTRKFPFRSVKKFSLLVNTIRRVLWQSLLGMPNAPPLNICTNSMGRISLILLY